MIVNKLLAIGILIPLLILIAPNVYASESNSKRYNDGFSNGGQAAATDKQQGNAYNPVCDPTGQYTSDGQHSTTYCNGWANGYSSAWNGNGGNSGQSTPIQSGNGQGSSGSGLLNKVDNFCHNHPNICSAGASALGHSLLGGLLG